MAYQGRVPWRKLAQTTAVSVSKLSPMKEAPLQISSACLLVPRGCIGTPDAQKQGEWRGQVRCSPQCPRLRGAHHTSKPRRESGKTTLRYSSRGKPRNIPAPQCLGRSWCFSVIRRFPNTCDKQTVPKRNDQSGVIYDLSMQLRHIPQIDSQCRPRNVTSRMRRHAFRPVFPQSLKPGFQCLGDAFRPGSVPREASTKMIVGNRRQDRNFRFTAGIGYLGAARVETATGRHASRGRYIAL